MSVRSKNSDPVLARLDRQTELLECITMLLAKRFGVARDGIRDILRVDANRISKVTMGVKVPK